MASCAGSGSALSSSYDRIASVAESHGSEAAFTDGMARAHYMSAVTDAINGAAANPALFFLNPSNDLDQLRQRLPAAATTPYCKALHADLKASAEGAVNEGELALALSDATRFKTWGGHYARSLVRAHQVQQCHNFKDPSVQLYSTLAFKKLLDVADCMFVLLPPPRVGRNKSSTALPGDRELFAVLPAARRAMLDSDPDNVEVSTPAPRSTCAC